uniref:Uncharacterized protein n=1 Tax=Quercus lobata TaxID=97700 RepID=A0A7N2R3A3_QUELO
MDSNTHNSIHEHGHGHVLQVEKVFHMTSRVGENSYSHNSALQREKGNDVGPCFIAGMPGSFYGRLFPSKSLDFVHSSYGVHWLSKVPQGINNNKGNIYMGKTSPHNVFEAYLEQFQSDFSLLLRSRADEIKLGGQMILTFIGRSIKDPTTRDCYLVLELLAKCLLNMAAEGLIEEADIDTFNLPHDTHFIEEVKIIVEKEGSFVIDQLETFEVNMDANDNEENKNCGFDKFTCGQNVSRCYRAVLESLLVDHFGQAIIDDLFERYAEFIVEYLSMEKTKNFNIVISMERK